MVYCQFSRRSVSSALVMAAVFVFAFAVATASDLVDQANDSEIPSVGWVIAGYSPVGQEFVPTLSEIDFVELFVENWSSSNPASIEVVLRVDTVDGVILGETPAVSVSPGYTGVIRCAFASTVSIEAGSRHVLLVRDNSLSGTYLFDTSDLYSSGRLILDGQPFDTEDAWFREGVVTTGTSDPVSTWGAIKSLFR